MSGRETDSFPGGNLPSLKPWRKRRSQRRKSLKRRALRWARACWPFAFVGGAALLSAGVVGIVESAGPPPRIEVTPPDTPRFFPVDHLLDVEFFDQQFYWDPSRIEDARDAQGAEIFLGEPYGSVDAILPETFLDDPARLLSVGPRVDAFIDFRSLPSVDAGPPRTQRPSPRV